jgi:hypothetical protein
MMKRIKQAQVNHGSQERPRGESDGGSSGMSSSEDIEEVGDGKHRSFNIEL